MLRVGISPPICCGDLRVEGWFSRPYVVGSAAIATDFLRAYLTAYTASE